MLFSVHNEKRCKEILSNELKTLIVIGAGIAGLTAAALLTQKDYQVTVYEQAIAVGGCASTFKRRGFTFDVGATQVAGLEPGTFTNAFFPNRESSIAFLGF